MRARRIQALSPFRVPSAKKNAPEAQTCKALIHFLFFGAAGRNRTHDPLVRSFEDECKLLILLTLGRPFQRLLPCDVQVCQGQSPKSPPALSVARGGAHSRIHPLCYMPSRKIPLCLDG
jgi:hypothetical protein